MVASGWCLASGSTAHMEAHAGAVVSARSFAEYASDTIAISGVAREEGMGYRLPFQGATSLRTEGPLAVYTVALVPARLNVRLSEVTHVHLVSLHLSPTCRPSQRRRAAEAPAPT